MKKHIATILTLGTLALFSCGEDNSQAEAEVMVNEIENVTAVTDSINNEIEAIENETNELDAMLDEL